MVEVKWLRRYFTACLGADIPLLDALLANVVLPTRTAPQCNEQEFLRRILWLANAVLRKRAPSLTPKSVSPEHLEFCAESSPTEVLTALLLVENELVFAAHRDDGPAIWRMTFAFKAGRLYCSLKGKYSRRKFGLALNQIRLHIMSLLENMSDMAESQLLFGRLPCNHCGETKRDRVICELCYSVFYCDLDCTIADLASHHKRCTEIQLEATGMTQ